MHSRFFRPNNIGLADLGHPYLYVRICWENVEDKKKAWVFEEVDFIMMLYGLSCLPLWTDAVWSHYVTDISVSVQHVTLSLLIRLASQPEYLFISVHCLVLCWFPPGVFWWSGMPWGLTPLWLIVSCREPWHFTPRLIARCAVQLPCKRTSKHR